MNIEKRYFQNPPNHQIIDIDDPSTWPCSIKDRVNQWAEKYRGSTSYASDLPIPLELESEFREHLGDHLLRAYHCTRLLSHEVRMIKANGLKTLNTDLIQDRIQAAQEANEISEEEAQLISQSNVFFTGEQDHRENQVCLILSKTVFQNHPSGCEPLLANWGGEGIYNTSSSKLLTDRLRSLGKPAIVVALISPNQPLHAFPSLHKVFVGAALGFNDVGADIFYQANIPPNHIEQVLQPGDHSYRSLGQLPQC
ncbi:MAG: hypothetical protein IPQ13_13785 [Holophagaceae bacterium]|nr:hypothetical protein [Holophagaceae bacterium]